MPTVLVVEDEILVRALLYRLLTQAEFRVIAARSGEEAVEIGASYEGPIHLLLTELRLPGISGFEVAAFLHVTRPQTRVVYMAGSAGGDMSDRLALGAPVIMKPFSGLELLEAIGEALC